MPNIIRVSFSVRFVNVSTKRLLISALCPTRGASVDEVQKQWFIMHGVRGVGLRNQDFGRGSGSRIWRSLIHKVFGWMLP